MKIFIFHSIQRSFEAGRGGLGEEGSLRGNSILLGNALLVVDVNFGEGYGVFLRIFGR